MELQFELEQFSTFDILKNEKITPQFLNIAKATKKEGSLADIKDDTGTNFT
jgi:hypothetical protein